MIQDNVTILDLSKQLYEAGVVVDSYFIWVITLSQYGDGIDSADVVPRMGRPNDKNGYTVIVPAPLSSELGELLPDQLEIDGYIYNLEDQKINNLWGVGYFTAMDDDEVPLAKLGTDTEANARAKMLIYLKKENLL